VLALIVAAPVGGGSSHILMLPVLAVLTAIAWTLTVISCRTAGRRLHIGFLPIALWCLAGFTVLQTFPLSRDLLAQLSPRAVQVRTFVASPGTAWPISYEPTATAREAAKLWLYGLVAMIAYERVRAHGRFEAIASAVIVAAIGAVGVGVAQRMMGFERM